MFQIKRKERVAATKHVLFYAQKCKACWNCISVCKNEVIGRVNLFFHKHAKIVNAAKCTGCKKCVKVCEHNAFVGLNKIEDVQ